MAGDSATAEDYDDITTERLLGVAADVLRSFGSAFGNRHLAIVGGSVPSLLVANPPTGVTRHVGTADLDLHLSLHLLDGETADYYQAIIDGLRSLGLGPDEHSGRVITWRWVGPYRGLRLQVEFLCPVRVRGGRPEAPVTGSPAEANIGPSREISALAVGYGHLVPDDTTTVERRVASRRGMLTFEFPLAGLASWLCLKVDAIMRRDKPKDAYDIVWLLTALGPSEAADRVAASDLLLGVHAGEVSSQLACLVYDQFLDTDAVGPSGYAAFLGADPGLVERRHAVGAMTAFGQELVARGVALH